MKEFRRLSEFTKINSNLYKFEDKLFKLFGMGITPNGCWILAPEMREVDIDIASGEYIYSGLVITCTDLCGTIQAGPEFIRYYPNN